MPLITDPDNLQDSIADDGSTNLYVDPVAKTIKLIPGVGGLDASDGVTEKAIFSKLTEMFHANVAKNIASYPFPFENLTDEGFELIEGWNWADQTTRDTIRNGGWVVRNTDGQIIEAWAGVKAIGNILPTDQLYHSITGSPVNFAFTGPVNQAIQIISDPNGDGDYTDGFDYSAPAGEIIYNREQGQTFAAAGLADIGETSLLAPKVFSFAVGIQVDGNIVATDAEIETLPLYTGMDITFHATPQTRDIGGANYDFGVIINGNGGTKQEILSYVNYQLRQISDIDADADIKVGKLQSLMLAIEGTNGPITTLAVNNPDGGGTGVYVDNFDNTQINDWTFTDNSGATPFFPFLAGLKLDPNDVALNDTTFKYFVYMTDPDATPDGDEWGTAGGLILEDKDGVPIEGLLGGSAPTFTIDYDGSTQGGRTPGTDIPITVVGVGITKNGAKYVRATGVIAKQAVNTVSLVSSINRQFENAA